MGSGATYSPGAWFALVSASAAVLVDPELPSDRLDELWRAVSAGDDPERTLAVLTRHGSLIAPAFALAQVDGDEVRLVSRGRIGVTLQTPEGHPRQVHAPRDSGWVDERVSTADTVWMVRPGAALDGVALPVAAAAVLADVVAWLPLAGSSAVPVLGERVAQESSAAATSPTRPIQLDQIVPAGAAPAAPQAGAVAVEVPDDTESVRRGGRAWTPEEIRAAAGRTTAGLGSHARRRYGAWDWSSDRGRSGAVVPQSRRPAAPNTRHDDSPHVPEEPVEAAPDGTEPDETAPDETDLVETPSADDASSVVAPAAAVVPEPVAEEPVADEPGVDEPVASEDSAPQPGDSGPVSSGPDDPEPEDLEPVVSEPVGSTPEAACGVLVFEDGATVLVDGPVLIGRAPSEPKGTDHPATLVEITTGGRGISRNHVRIDVGVGGAFAIDLGSRNGCAITDPDGVTTRLIPWFPHPLRVGSRLTYAEASCEFREA